MNALNKLERYLLRGVEGEILAYAANVTGLIAVDSTTTILYCSPYTEQLFGYQPQELIGKSISILLPEKSRSVHNEHIKQWWLSGQPDQEMNQRGPIEGVKKDGSTVQLAISLTKGKAGDQDIGIAVILPRTIL